MKISSKQAFYIAFTIFLTGVFGWIMFHELKYGDYPQHIAWAKELSATGYLYKIPHPLFAKLVTMIRALLPANILVWVSAYAKQVYDLKSFEISTVILMTLSYLATGYIIVKKLLREWVDLKTNHLHWFAGISTILLMLVGPIFFFTFPERMYLGYISGNPYHSPTFILLKPFGLLVFIGLSENMLGKWDLKKALLMVFAIVCATLAKPSLTITILPALFIVLFIFNYKRLKQFNWFHLIFAVGLTSFIVLLGQFLIAYAGDRGDRIILAPFKEILFHVPNLPSAFLFLLMSIMFPLLVLIFNWQEVKNQIPFQLGWINFIIGVLSVILLSETANFGSGNFWWGPMIGVVFLFLTSFAFVVRKSIGMLQQNHTLSWREFTTLGVFVLHSICGIIYFVAVLTSSSVLVV
jgi:hypothetical protein